MSKKIKYFVLGILSVCVLLFVLAYMYASVPRVIVPENVGDIHLIEDAEQKQIFYGDLNDFPHTYEVRVTEPITLYTEIRVPNISESENVISGIIIKEQKRGTRVLEIARLHAREGGWESIYDPYGGDSYRQGPSFETVLDVGVYRIEVHTPNNKEKYALHVGTNTNMDLGYFELLGRLIEVKNFFGKSSFMLIQSMFVYPLVVLVCTLLIYAWYGRRSGKGDV